jgi:hypothetical protein
VYRLAGNEIGLIIGDEDLVDMYAAEERPAWSRDIQAACQA